MEPFEFVFTLFSLLLGLAIAEVLSGFGRAIREHERVRIGWLSPLLAVIVLFDLTSFWSFAWSARGVVPVSYFPLLCGLIVTGIYYLAATLTFPADFARWSDLDDYFFRYRRWVLGGIFICNITTTATLQASGLDIFATQFDLVNIGVFYAALVAAFFVRGRRLSAAVLLLFASLYPLLSGIAFFSSAKVN